MKKPFAFLIIFVIFSSILFCYELTLVSKGESISVAQYWLNYINKIPLENKVGEYQIGYIEQVFYDNNLLCEIYHLYPRGHILVNSYKELVPVKSFSVVSDFDSNSKGYEYAVLEELKSIVDFLESYKEEEIESIEKAIRNNRRNWIKKVRTNLRGTLLQKSVLTQTEKKIGIQKFILGDIEGIKLESTVASPLLESAWHQIDPYWDHCPMWEGQRCVVGCVATAMAQIMRYYSWPNSGVGSHSYVWPGVDNPNIEADFSDEYDWDNIPYNTSDYDTQAEIDAVAELCYEAGVSVNMGYNTSAAGGSGAYVWDVATALKEYFRYKDDVDVVWRYDYADSDAWFDVFKTQRDLERPVEFALYGLGHAAVVDGYLTDGALKQLHINMGWEDVSYNTWYTLGLLWNEHYFDHAIINIIPDLIELTLTSGIGGTTDPTPGTYSYQEGEEVTITATPESDYRFDSWTGDVPEGHENDNPLTITMDSDKSIKANFIRQYKLAITAGKGGTTDPSPGTHAYDEGTKVTVTAVPDSNYRFDKWSGDASGTDNPVIITMDSDKSITASFIRLYKLTISVSQGGTTDPVPGIHIYDEGTKVTITATPDSHYIFNGWTGDASGATNPITITMDSDKNITANFIKINPPLNFAGKRVENRALARREYINVLTWEQNPKNNEGRIKIVKYLIFYSGQFLAEVNADTFEYLHHGVQKYYTYVYEIVAVDETGVESEHINTIIYKE